MKKNHTTLKNKSIIIIVMFFVTLGTVAQDIHFTFANAHNTTEGNDVYYEADILIESTTPFKLGSGQIYLTFNPQAFGENVSDNARISYSYDEGYILGEQYVLPAYKSFIKNDNTTSRVSFTFQQGVSAETITENNITSTPSLLFHVKIKYIDASQDPMVAFEEKAVFQDQFFTACGSMAKSGAKAGFPDCAVQAGVQLVNDTYDSSGAVLEILSTEEFEVSSLTLYPNPASDNFFVKGLKENSGVKIFDLNGKKIKEISDYNGSDTIDVQQLQAGIYFVKFTLGGVSNTMKLVKR